MKTKDRRLGRAKNLRQRSGRNIDQVDVLAKLQADRANHLHELERLKAALLDLPEASIEEADPAVAEQAQTRAQLTRITEHLREIDHAIEAAVRPDYGICEKCGEPIDPARLAILPETRLCIKCKRESEKFKQHPHR